MEVTECILGLGSESPIYVFCQNAIENLLGFVLMLGLCQELKHLTSRTLSCCSLCNTGRHAVRVSKKNQGVRGHSDSQYHGATVCLDVDV